MTLQVGVNYKFKVQARNAVGYSLDSSEITIRAARVPDVPTNVLTSIDGSNVLISWTPNYNGGSEVLSYTVEILASDGTYIVDETGCKGDEAYILANRECYLPVTTLRSDPWFLDWGDSVFARVKVTNVVGNTAYSVVGNGALISSIPDAPFNLANNLLISSKT